MSLALLSAALASDRGERDGVVGAFGGRGLGCGGFLGGSGMVVAFVAIAAMFTRSRTKTDGAVGADDGARAGPRARGG